MWVVLNVSWNCKHQICVSSLQHGEDPAGNWTTWRSPYDHKKTQTAVVWSCLPFIRSGQNHLARHSERGKKTRRTKEEVGRQHQEMDWSGVRQVQFKGQWRTGKKWRKLVAKSSVVPQRSSQLRDWWWWWWFSCLSCLIHPCHSLALTHYVSLFRRLFVTSFLFFYTKV